MQSYAKQVSTPTPEELQAAIESRDLDMTEIAAMIANTVRTNAVPDATRRHILGGSSAAAEKTAAVANESATMAIENATEHPVHTNPPLELETMLDSVPDMNVANIVFPNTTLAVRILCDRSKPPVLRMHAVRAIVRMDESLIPGVVGTLLREFETNHMTSLGMFLLDIAKEPGILDLVRIDIVRTLVPNEWIRDDALHVLRNLCETRLPTISLFLYVDLLWILCTYALEETRPLVIREIFQAESIPPYDRWKILRSALTQVGTAGFLTLSLDYLHTLDISRDADILALVADAVIATMEQVQETHAASQEESKDESKDESKEESKDESKDESNALYTLSQDTLQAWLTELERIIACTEYTARLRADLADVLQRYGTRHQLPIGTRMERILREIGTEGLDKLATIYDNRENIHEFNFNVLGFLELMQRIPPSELSMDEMFAIIATYIPPTESANDAFAMARYRIEYHVGKTLQSHTLGEIFQHVFAFIEQHPARDELRQRLAEELLEMAYTCTSGAFLRLINVLTGFVDAELVFVSWPAQIRATLFARLTTLLQHAMDSDDPPFEPHSNDDTERREEAKRYDAHALLVEFCSQGRITERPQFLRFLRRHLSALREELLEEYLEHVGYNFDEYFRLALASFEGIDTV